MNNQSIRSTWKMMEDYPTKDGFYLVAFENSFGDFDVASTEVWEFEGGTWFPVKDDGLFPTFYIDLPMPTLT